jgi:hypothetical protein
MAILSILGTLTFSALSGAAKLSKIESTEFMINKLNDAILDWYEEYEDEARPGGLWNLRRKMREELPDSWAEVSGGANARTPETPAGRAYATYRAIGAAHDNFTKYQSAECLYMIITRSGRIPDFVESIQPGQVGDIDADGLFEFWDGWERPIAFFRWAPGFSPFSIIQNETATGDPFDISEEDPNAFPLFPLIYSPGPDEAMNDPLSGPDGYGLVTASAGWPDAAFQPQASGASPIVNFDSGSGIVGAPKTDNPTAYVDNITNHALMAE